VGAGAFVFYGIPAYTQYPRTSLTLTSEAINPLYVGAYAVGPYRMGQVTPSGSSLSVTVGSLNGGQTGGFGRNVVVDAANECNGAGAGTEGAPATVPDDGAWSGRLCGLAKAAWSSVAVRAGRTATLEVIATDDAGSPTTGKAMPVAGFWHASDATGGQPTMASTPSAFNALKAGLTQLRVQFATREQVRFAIADRRGDQRPDYGYRARLLYADRVTPARLGPQGGTVVLDGMGFSQGATVTVGGVVATVLSLSAREIALTAPALSALHGQTLNDVTVTDPATGASTTIAGGLVYGGAPTDVLQLVAAPTGAVNTGAAVPFAVKLVDGTGSPAQNASITVSGQGGAMIFAACGLATCTLLTNQAGIAQTSLAAGSAGSVTLTASAASGSTVRVAFTAVAPAKPVEYVAAERGATFNPVVTVTSNGMPVQGQSVTWTSSSQSIGIKSSGTSSGGNGSSAISATGQLRDGETTTLQACAWSSVCATQTVLGVPDAELRIAVSSGDGQTLQAGGTLGPVAFRVTDGGGHVIVGAAVAIHQAVTGWQPACSAPGRCPSAPLYGTGVQTAMTDEEGMVVATPLQYPGAAAITMLTASAGSAGSVTAVLQKTP
jgi:hypothetical protein